MFVFNCSKYLKLRKYTVIIVIEPSVQFIFIILQIGAKDSQLGTLSVPVLYEKIQGVGLGGHDSLQID